MCQTLVGGNEIWLKLLHDAQAQVVLPCMHPQLSSTFVMLYSHAYHKLAIQQAVSDIAWQQHPQPQHGMGDSVAL